MRNIILGFSLVGLAAGLAGCRGASRTPWDNLKAVQEQNTDLSLKVQQLEAENQQLKQQVDTLSGVNKEARLTELDTLAAIKIHKRTNFYDKDKDGTRETLVVYVQTLDSQQDQVKTPGTCKIELWNLGADSENKLGQCTIEPKDLQKLWGGNVFAEYYRIELPVEKVPQKGTELTVRAVFTDLLSGKVLSDQWAFKY